MLTATARQQRQRIEKMTCQELVATRARAREETVATTVRIAETLAKHCAWLGTPEGQEFKKNLDAH